MAQWNVQRKPSAKDSQHALLRARTQTDPYRGTAMADCEKNREAIAFHEAGHAVADVFHKIPFTSVGIERTPDGYGGEVVGLNLPEFAEHLKYGKTRKSIPQLKRFLICNHAGEVAQRKVEPDMDVTKIKEDLKQQDHFFDMIADINGYRANEKDEKLAGLIDELKERTSRFVNSHDPEIREVANELIRKAAKSKKGIGKLSYDDVCRIVENHRRPARGSKAQTSSPGRQRRRGT